MHDVSMDATLGQCVAERPGRARVFERLGLDFCCGGGRETLASACSRNALDPEEVLRALEQQDEVEPTPDRAWLEAPLDEVIDHVLATHHVYLKEELPRLSAMLAKVVERHAGRHPELREALEVFSSMRDELDAHMAKEERILFPMIRELANAASLPGFHCGSVGNPIGVMEREHESAGAALARLRALTHQYTPPDDACGTHRAVLDGLAELEADLHRHIHLENHVLFPGAARAEQALRNERSS